MQASSGVKLSHFWEGKGRLFLCPCLFVNLRKVEIKQRPALTEMKNHSHYCGPVRQNRQTKYKLIQHIEGCHHPRQVDSLIPFAVSRESSVIQSLPLAKRKFLANFLGHAQGKQGWLQLIKLGKQFPQEVCSSFMMQWWIIPPLLSKTQNCTRPESVQSCSQLTCN